MTRLSIKLGRKQQQAMQQAARQAMQAARQEKALEDQLNSLNDKAEKAKLKQREVQEARAKKLLKIGQDWAAKSGIDLPDAVVQIRRLYQNTIAMNVAPIATVINAIESAVKDPANTTLDQINAMVIQLAGELVA